MNEKVWLSFACAALTGKVQSSHWPARDAARIADEMYKEYEVRYGELKFILDGIRDCRNCSKSVVNKTDVIVSDGKDGEYKKFCNLECMDAFLAKMIAT